MYQLTFGGQTRITIPAGGDVVSDPVSLTTSVHQELTVSLYLAKGQIGKNTTAHDKAHTTTWVAAGDQTTHASLSKGTPTTHWYYLAEIQGQLPSTSTALICVGDSITDGTGSGNNDNNRWVDELFRRMQSNPETNNIAVLNAGIGSNHLITTLGEGPTAVEGIKGIIVQPGVRYVALLDGVNDIGHTVATDAGLNTLHSQMTRAIEEIISEVHPAGLVIFGGTLTPSFVDPPYSGSPSTSANPNRAALRDRLNKWILSESKFDHVVDYAAAVANKTKPDQYQDRYA
ncbi:hypothetical protein NLG97_g2211 [Lecanicillium saksenae]|uniref:Uncharacterized protein n=1 Tax=Lecanicillium saksenae TaxID=468837 RepID=A0ACC1R2S7_9HYPO|nr:hypothetical protein NLG97_g2211 [Lecanicillium saksenae]